MATRRSNLAARRSIVRLLRRARHLIVAINNSFLVAEGYMLHEIETSDLKGILKVSHIHFGESLRISQLALALGTEQRYSPRIAIVL